MVVLREDGNIRQDFHGAWDNNVGDALGAMTPAVENDGPRQVVIYSVEQSGRRVLHELPAYNAHTDPLC